MSGCLILLAVGRFWLQWFEQPPRLVLVDACQARVSRCLILLAVGNFWSQWFQQLKLSFTDGLCWPIGDADELSWQQNPARLLQWLVHWETDTLLTAESDSASLALSSRNRR